MRSRLVTILRRGAALLGVALLTILAVRAWDSRRGPGLEPWHTFVPEELHADDLASTDWSGYLRAEDAAFDAVRASVVQHHAGGRPGQSSTRYAAASPVYPPKLAHDWNRSFVLVPTGHRAAPSSSLHGLTDAPYSTRHVAEMYRRTAG